MRKNFGVKTWVYPMPVFIVGTYDEDGTPNAMNAAWGGVYDTDQIMLCLSHSHKTTENIKRSGAFTLSFATSKSRKTMASWRRNVATLLPANFII